MNPAPHPGKKRGEFPVGGTPTPPAEGCALVDSRSLSRQPRYGQLLPEKGCPAGLPLAGSVRGVPLTLPLFFLSQGRGGRAQVSGFHVPAFSWTGGVSWSWGSVRLL